MSPDKIIHVETQQPIHYFSQRPRLKTNYYLDLNWTSSKYQICMLTGNWYHNTNTLHFPTKSVRSVITFSIICNTIAKYINAWAGQWGSAPTELQSSPIQLIVMDQ